MKTAEHILTLTKSRSWNGIVDNETYVTLDDDSGLVFNWNIDILANKLSGGKALTPPGFVPDEDDDEDINNEDSGAITW